MKNDAGNNQSMDLKERQFPLPFSDENIRVNPEGARQVARLACEMAVSHSSPIESDKQYATRLATFMCGCIANQCDSSQQKMALFNDFLEEVYAWLGRGCNECAGTHHWNVFHESHSGADEVQRADQLDNL
ncbi:MAG: hypothetical protein JRD49_15420 [Deltaproteobacteria bacterium]|nr:hypothetical protein [Deltaproteobacteria bacterium]MBW2678939.1 hypothetical protein [Deltaproteobacteria bacterium]